MPKRQQSPGEEIANSISHGIGLVAALVATPFLIMQAAQREDAGFIVGASLFATTMILLYLASTLYHALPTGKAKRVFRVIEHAAIFLLIAGTYTPFTLGVLRGGWGWTLFGLVWGLAVAGVALKAMVDDCPGDATLCSPFYPFFAGCRGKPTPQVGIVRRNHHVNLPAMRPVRLKPADCGPGEWPQSVLSQKG
jgi:predicted membrane channel-forming protein YqfA (hemolysin III family)